MRSVFAAFLMSLGVSALLTPLVRRFAVRVGAMDAGGGRKVHAGHIPRMGGVAIVLGFYAPLTALLFLDAGINALFLKDEVLVLGLFVGGLAIAALGLWDDLRGADAVKKFSVQFAVATLMYFCGFQIDSIANPLTGATVFLGWLAFPITLLWVAGVINAVNLIDGLDGLAGGVAIFVLGTLFVLGAMQDRVLACLLCAAAGVATLGFLFYNFNPATIFMGDTGSLFLGFVISAMSINGSRHQKSSTAVAVAIPLLALGLPLADTALAMFRRALRGRSMFSADREHIHHKLLDLGLSHRQAVLVLYSACLLLAGASLASVYLRDMEAAALLVVIGLIAAVLFHRLGYLSLESMRRDITVGRAETAALRVRRDDVRTAFARGTDPFTPARLMEALRQSAAPLGFDEVTLLLHPPALSIAAQQQFTFATGLRPVGAPGLNVRYVLEGPAGTLVEMVYVYRDGRAALAGDDQSLLDLLHDELIARVEEATPSNVIPLRRRVG